MFVFVYPSWAVPIRPVRVGCLQKSLSANEFSQHRHRSFRLVIASLQIRPTTQRRAQLKHLETTLRTPPLPHTHRLRADRQRQATRRQQETTQATEARCVCVSVLGCVYASVYPSCARRLLAKKFGCKRGFAASSSLFSPCDRLPPVWTNGTKKSLSLIHI